MPDNKPHEFSITGLPLYPHLKLTREAFPRVLATRILENDNVEYFGAFLNRTAVRILIDFLNRTFRLRSCDIEIDGKFPVPCTQYFAKRCVAPCVESLCDREKHNDRAEAVRMFLRNDRGAFTQFAGDRIGNASQTLDFETAAAWRDISNAVEIFWSKPRWKVWLDDAVDTFAVDERNDLLRIFLVTQRRSRTLGQLTFIFPNPQKQSRDFALGSVIAQFYQHHVPREIRVPFEFDGRKAIAATLGNKFRKRLPIKVVKPGTGIVTTARAFEKSKQELTLRETASAIGTPDVLSEMKTIFGLSREPKRIEAFDVAHISGSGFVAGRSIWQSGKFVTEKDQIWLSARESELATLESFVQSRFASEAIIQPDLALIDGGLSHLRAALKGVEAVGGRWFAMIAAVKPPGKHTDISYFIFEDGSRLEFDAKQKSMQLLQVIRDEAHNLANAAHRLTRDMHHFYELAAILPSLNEKERQNLLTRVGSIKRLTEAAPEKLIEVLGKKRAQNALADLQNWREGKMRPVRPLIVPIRFDDPDGNAADLIPIQAL